MKNVTTLVSLLVIGAAGIATAADPGTTMTQETTTISVSTTPVQSQSSAMNTAPASAPIMHWTEFQGKVMRVDLQNKIVQIREGNTDTLIEVPINQNVKIYKKGSHEYALGDIKEGDKVTIRNQAS